MQASKWERVEQIREILEDVIFLSTDLLPLRRIQGMRGVFLELISAETTTQAAKKLPM